MKIAQKELARKLREDGLSLKEIAQRLGVAKSSVSVWVRDIVLTEEQEDKLYERNSFAGKGWQKHSDTCRDKRRKFQELGRNDAKQNNILHAFGCSLFWAEGAKRNNSVVFVNSDPDMMIIFIRFLRECFNVPNDAIKVSVNCYIDNSVTSEKIERYWLHLLSLPETCLNKTMINKISKYSKKMKKNKLVYGICRLVVHSTELNQRIFGAIKHYAGINDESKWLF